MLGDSRTGQMGNAVGSASHPGTAFVACFGGGVDWLSGQKAKQDIDRFVTPGSVIILNYGVNDLSRHNDYIPLINRYAQDWRKKGASVYFASVGPVGENAYGKRNWAVEYFNGQLGGRLDQGIGRIDLYGYLTAAGYETLPDGLHYTPDTYARMFQFLCQSVGR
ncbi:MAG: SGNH/GDSL hydrolase family protein [Eisenbergiella sp.]